MLEVGSLEWNKRSIVIPGIVGFPASLFDHDPFGITSAAADLRIDIILSIATGEGVVLGFGSHARRHSLEVVGLLAFPAA